MCDVIVRDSVLFMDDLLVNPKSRDNHKNRTNLLPPDIGNEENRIDDFSYNQTSVKEHTMNPTACLMCLSSSQDEPAYCN